MKPTMKAVQVERPGQLRVIELPTPQLDEENNVLIKMRAAGICGSDVHIYHGTNAAATYPRIIGHEMVGEVIALGTGATRLQIGQRVIVDQVVNCGECYACKKGRPNVCHNLQVRGVHIDGGYREYMAVPEKDCYLLPAGLTNEDAVMIEPTTIAIQCLSRAEIEPEDTLLVIGCGALGSTVLKVAKNTGATIIMADIVQAKLDEALQNGADHAINLSQQDLNEAVRALTGGYGATITVDCACTSTSLLQALQATGCAGRVITMGFSVEPCEVNQFLITSKELDVRGSRLQNRKFAQAIEMIEQGKLDLNGVVSHTFPLEQAQQAFDFVDSGEASIRKVVLTFAP